MSGSLPLLIQQPIIILPQSATLQKPAEIINDALIHYSEQVTVENFKEKQVQVYANPLVGAPGNLLVWIETSNSYQYPVEYGSKRKPPADNLGDVDGDGWVTSEDAQWVTEWIAGTRQLTSEQLRRADVNASGTITAADATAIAQYAVGTIDSFVAAYGAGLYNILGVEAILVDGAERLLTLPWTAHSKYARLAMSCVGGTAAAYWVSRATFAGKNV